MNKIDLKHKEIVAFLTKNSEEKVVQKLSKYFKEGLDAYGIEKDIYITQINTWLATWETDMTIDDYLDFGDNLVATGKFSLSYRNEKNFLSIRLTGLENGLKMAFKTGRIPMCFACLCYRLLFSIK